METMLQWQATESSQHDFIIAGGAVQGVLVTLAIGFHNIPEGLAVATVLVARGVSAKSALTWCACLLSFQDPFSCRNTSLLYPACTWRRKWQGVMKLRS
jgi:hypothetical protein